MLKLFTRGLAVLALLLLALPIALLALLRSEAGTSFIASQLQQKLGANLQWQQLQGTLTGPLQIRELQYTQPGLSARVQTLVLDWDPSALLAGQLQLASLKLDGLSLSLSGSEGEASAPFNPADIQLPLDIDISDAHLTNVQLIQGDQSLYIDAIRLKARLEDRELVVDRLSLALTGVEASLRGKLLLEASMPLDIHTGWTWQQDKSAPMNGKANIAGTIEWSQAIEIAIEYAIDASGLATLKADMPDTLGLRGKLEGNYGDNALSLESLTLERAGTDLALEIAGTLGQLDSGSPTLDHRVQWRALSWPLDADIAPVESARGELDIKGSLDDYQLELALDLSGADIPPGDWSLQGRGNQSSLELDPLTGHLLTGAISASGRLAWAPKPAWDLQLTARDINPEPLVQQLPGSISAQLDISGEIKPDQQIQAQLELQRLSGQLAGYPLEVNGRADITGNRVEFSRLELNSGRNQLLASGSVNADTLDLKWRLRALAPGELLSGAGGSLSGNGEVEGSPQAPRISGQLLGEDLKLDTLESSALAMEFTAGTQPADELMLDLSAGPVTHQGGPLLQSLQLEASGTNAQHLLKAALDRGNEQLTLSAAGGLSPDLDGWRGAIETLRLNTGRWGQWSQQKPATLEAAADSASLGDFCLQQSDGAGKLCLAGNWSTIGDSQLSLSANALPLSLIQPAIGGDVRLRLEGSLATDGALLANGAMEVSPGQIKLADPGQNALSHGGGTLELTIDDSGLAATVDFDAPESGTLEGRVALPALNRLPLTEQQPLEGEVLASLPDLSGLAAWVPQLSATGGSIKTDMQLAGTLAQPQLTGKMALARGRADIPSAGLQLRDMQLQVASDETRNGALEVSGLASSGDGHLLLFGLLDPAKQTLEIELAGDDFQAYNTRDARVSIAPDLQIKWLDNTLVLRGEVLVPRAEITPTLQLNSALSSDSMQAPGTSGQAIAPSADVVIINGELEGLEEEELTAPFRIDNLLRLRLGREVQVDALGFMGRITGDVLFTNSPQQDDLIPIAEGKLSVENGTFRSFGQDLDIRTGELLFNRQPATEPEINLRAVRWIDSDPQVSAAGIILTGPITTPTMELFSRPQLETSEVQSYLLTGRSTGDRNSVLSIGTYVSPRIYVGYGYNTLQKTSEFNSLFTITPRYGVGLDVGEADNNLNMTFSYEH